MGKGQTQKAGHIKEGLKVDPENVHAITEMPGPTDVKGIQRLVGICQSFMNTYQMTEILRQLTHKESLWDWL